MTFFTAFLGCLAALALWKWFEKRRAKPIDSMKPIVVHEVFDKSRGTLSHTCTAFINPETRRFEVRHGCGTSSSVRIYDYRLTNGAVYARLVDDYDNSHHRSPQTPLYDVFEGVVMEEHYRAHRAKGLNPEKVDEEIEWMKAETVWHRLHPDEFNSIGSVLSTL